MKDRFSFQASQYAQYRPHYPTTLYAYLQEIISNKEKAWDCGTGNGQVATQLATFFDTVFATDISKAQLAAASSLPNLHYSQQPAEQTNFPDHSFDLIVVAQAIHWFDFNAFYKEVYRTLKEEGVLVVIGYGLVQVNAIIDAITQVLYYDILGDFWDEERKYIDEHYQTIPFPFEERTPPTLSNTLPWSCAHFLAYLQTWSAVKHFVQQKGYNPIEQVRKQYLTAWRGTEKVHFPMLLRVGNLKRADNVYQPLV
ncbi:MAG: class I SAM-dependent methyltransferase [Thermonemataceae bacterium]